MWLSVVHDLGAWAARHRIPQQALKELLEILIGPPGASMVTHVGATLEASTQGAIRLAAAGVDLKLWRNNVGVLNDDRGIPVRFGLANDSHRVNQRIKSSDLIGVLSLDITSAHVGRRIGVLAAIETKRLNWEWRATGREVAQKRFMDIVILAGGCAGFARTPDDLKNIVEAFKC